MRVRGRLIYTVLAVLLLPALPAGAQITSTMRGVVTDAGGGVLPGATVTVESPDLRRGSASDTTDAEGRYRITGLQAGVYKATVELAGFANAVRNDVVLPLNQEITVDVTLELAGVVETVTVSAEVAVVRANESGLGFDIDSRTIDNMPLNGRQFLDLLTLVPGVASRPFSSDQGSNITVFGERSITNSFLIDGHDNNDLFSRSSSEFFVQDAIQEFQVYLAGYPAEFGRASGAVANVITRSGTNEIDGRAFLFLRNDALDSSNIEGQDPQALNRVELGGTLGGPIRRGKTFFFDAFQFLREERGLNFDQSLLTDGILEGYFAPALGGETFDAAPLLRNVTNFFKLDHQFNQRNQIFVSVNINRGKYDSFVPTPEQGFVSPPPGSITLPSTASDIAQDSTSVNGRYTAFFSDTSFIESSLRWSKQTYQENTEKPQGAEQLFPITFVPTFQIWVSNAPFVGLIDREQERFQWTESLSYYAESGAGSHAIKLGGDVDRVSLDHLLIPPTSIILGNSALDGRFRELGYDISMQRFVLPVISENERSQASTTNVAFFAQDAWEIKPGLTLNLGLRWDYASLFSDDKTSIAPRLGLAWDVRNDQRTVLRAGFGRFYDQTILESVVFTPELGGVQLGNFDRQIIPRGGSFYNNPSIGAYGPLQDSGTRWLSNPLFYSYILPLGDVRTSGDITIVGQGRPYVVYELLGIPVTDPASPPVLAYDTIGTLTGGRLTPEAAAAILNASFPGPNGPQFSFMEETGENSINSGRPLQFLFRQLRPEIDFIQTIQRPHRTPYTDSFNAGVEQAIGKDFSVDAEVFVRRSRDLLTRRVTNLREVPIAATCTGNTVDGQPCARELQYLGFLDTEALTLALRKRFSSNYSFLVGYTYTHALDNFSTLRVPPRGGEQSFLLNNHPELDEGRSLNTPVHVLVASGLYRLPHGFDVSGVVRATSGRPFNAAGLPQDSDGDDIFDNRLIDTEKGEFLTDPFFQLDLRLSKELSFSGRTRITLLIEAFNVTNRANPFVVNRQFGPRIGENVQPLPGREIQLGFRFDF